MATNSATLSIKTTPTIKAQIQEAADQLGLSVNSFIIMVATNAARSDEIVLKKKRSLDAWAERAVEEWEQSDQHTVSADEFDTEFRF